MWAGLATLWKHVVMSLSRLLAFLSRTYIQKSLVGARGRCLVSTTTSRPYIFNRQCFVVKTRRALCTDRESKETQSFTNDESNEKTLLSADKKYQLYLPNNEDTLSLVDKCEESNKPNADIVHVNEFSSVDINSSITCNGCGTMLQCTQPNTQGYVPAKKLHDLIHQLQSNLNEQGVTPMDVNTSSCSKHSESPRQPSHNSFIDPPICQRCFYLSHYNTALDVTLPADEYKRHLSNLRDRQALILCIVDVIDFPSSLIPALNTIINPHSTVYFIANKVDLLPDLNKKALKRLETHILSEAHKHFHDLKVTKLFFVSAKTKRGVDELTDAITTDWDNRGDVYLLGCTNVGKSSLFTLLLHSLCGAKPGDVKTTSKVPAPAPTISHWPGTTLGVLSFPILSMGKRRRLLAQAKREEKSLEEYLFNNVFEEDIGEDSKTKSTSKTTPLKDRTSLPLKDLVNVDNVLKEIDLKKFEKVKGEGLPQNRFWLCDTPGAVNNTQLINYLTTKELNLFLPKKPLSPRTFILKPGQSIFIGGLARLDYKEGPVSAYFTVFASSYLPLHTTHTDRADELYRRNLGQPLLKIPLGDSDRLSQFPQLESLEFKLTGIGWKQCLGDIILSSAGWVAVTIGEGQVVKVQGHTPKGKGIYMRMPSLFPNAINERGHRSQKGNRTVFLGKKSLKRSK